MMYRVTYQEHGRTLQAYFGHSPREAVLECSILEANGVKPKLERVSSKGRESVQEAA